jgi:hypothetical protein
MDRGEQKTKYFGCPTNPPFLCGDTAESPGWLLLPPMLPRSCPPAWAMIQSLTGEGFPCLSVFFRVVFDHFFDITRKLRAAPPADFQSHALHKNTGKEHDSWKRSPLEGDDAPQSLTTLKGFIGLVDL